MNSKLINHLGLEMGIVWSSCPVMLKDAQYSGQKLLEQKTISFLFSASVKDIKMLYSDWDFPHYPDMPLSDFLCTKPMSRRLNVPPFSLRTVFPQAQPDMNKRHPFFSSFLKSHNPTKKLCAQLQHQGQQRHFTHYKPMLAAFFMRPGLLDTLLSLTENENWSPCFTALNKTLCI